MSFGPEPQSARSSFPSGVWKRSFQVVPSKCITRPSSTAPAQQPCVRRVPALLRGRAAEVHHAAAPDRRPDVVLREAEERMESARAVGGILLEAAVLAVEHDVARTASSACDPDVVVAA